MEIPWDDKIILFLAFLIPGFIIREVYGLFVGIDQADTHKLLPTIVGFSALHYGVTAFPLFLLPQGGPRFIFAYFDVLLLPVKWPPIALLFRDFNLGGSCFSAHAVSRRSALSRAAGLRALRSAAQSSVGSTCRA